MVFFFFQAEDGIRDLTVTGVQTCALPISPRPRLPARRSQQQLLERLTDGGDRFRLGGRGACRPRDPLDDARPLTRSEERRVGKECRSRWWPDHLRKNEFATVAQCRGRSRW